MLSTLSCATLPMRPPRKACIIIPDDEKDEPKEKQEESESESSEAAAVLGMAKPVR